MEQKQEVYLYEPPQDIREIVSTDPFLTQISINSISPVTGGVAHQVYEITSENQRFYLKIRGNRFVQIPEIECEPADIRNEYTALSLFCSVAPNNFPQVLSFNPEKHYLVLSDAIPNGNRFEDLFLRRQITPPMIFNFGRTLANIHRATAHIDSPIRPEGDNAYYQTILQHRFGYRNHPSLNQLIEQLSTLEQRQLILGDPSPKNIGVNDSGTRFIFFDLETAHQGNPVFDYSYALGHVIIHYLDQPDKIIGFINTFSEGYGNQHKYLQSMVKKIALGTVLYRLNSIIPYPIPLAKEQAIHLEQQIEQILLSSFETDLWTDIITVVNSL